MSDTQVRFLWGKQIFNIFLDFFFPSEMVIGLSGIME